jgi:hypothetical protein
MPYRMMVDSTGAEWQVWDVVPRLNERRADLQDRRVEIKAIPFADRRQSAVKTERRRTEVRRAVLSASYAHGWLCFERKREKRRLAPIPSDWTVCSDEKLEEYMRAARPVQGSNYYMTLTDEEPPTMAEAG